MKEGNLCDLLDTKMYNFGNMILKDSFGHSACCGGKWGVHRDP